MEEFLKLMEEFKKFNGKNFLKVTGRILKIIMDEF